MLQLVNRVDIGRTKLDISVQVRKAIRPKVNVELSVPIFDDVYVKAFGIITFPASYIKNAIIKEAKNRIESELRAFIAALR